MFEKLLCKIFGHNWKAYGLTKDINGIITINEIKCTRCGLTKKNKEK